MKYRNLKDISSEVIITEEETFEDIIIQDQVSINTGEHFGRIKSFETFQGKDNNLPYAKITVGTLLNLPGGQHVVVEVDRVWMAYYRHGSNLIEQMRELGAIENNKFCPRKLFNLPIKFEVTLDDKVSENSKYRERISHIEKIEKLPDESNFNYVKVRTYDGIEVIPTNEHIKVDKQYINKKPRNKMDFSKFDESDEDYLSALDEDE